MSDAIVGRQDKGRKPDATVTVAKWRKGNHQVPNDYVGGQVEGNHRVPDTRCSLLR
jgi:hypothetical protein